MCNVLTEHLLKSDRHNTGEGRMDSLRVFGPEEGTIQDYCGSWKSKEE